MNFTKSLRVLLLCIYCGMSLVCGQPTTDDNVCTDDMRKLIETVAELRAEQAKSADRIAKLEDKVADLESQLAEQSAAKLDARYAAGPHYNESGSGSNFLCVHEHPQWKTYRDGHTYPTGSIYGVEYELNSANNVFSETNNGGNPLYNKPGPCAVCYVGGRSTILMVPARTQCPDGWTNEYSGYVVSEMKRDAIPASDARKRSSYICWDEAPEVVPGETNRNQAVIYPVEVQCGSLPCSVYTSGRELTCIVCSK